MKRIDLRIIGIIGFAVLLRSLLIGSRGILYDDAFSIFLSRRPLGDIISGTAADTMPPLYYFLLHGWGLISQELGWLRLLSLILSIGVVLVSYLWMCRFAGRQVGLFTAFIVAISPLQIYHAQDLRPYALLSLTILSYWYFFLRLWQDGKKQQVFNWMGLILASLASLYTHNLAGFMLLPPYFFLLFRKNWKWLLKLGSLHSVTLLLFLPWLMVLPGQIEKIQTAFWTPRPGVVEVFQTILMWASNLPLSDPLLWIASVLVFSSFYTGDHGNMADSKESWVI